jgi:hypothetical protein
VPEDRKADHTFIVDAEYAQPSELDRLARNIDEWTEVAHEVFVGEWCAHYECYWKDIPVYVHRLPNGTVVKYGYCRTQFGTAPDRELWYVAFRKGPTFVVDQICAQPNYIDRIGTDTIKWQLVCWQRLPDDEVA